MFILLRRRIPEMEKETIQTERSRGDARRINVPLLTQFLDGGKARYQRKMNAFKMILSDPSLQKENPYDLTPEQDREITMRQLKRVTEILPTLPDDDARESFIFAMGYYDRSVEMRLGVHYNLFRPILKVQGTEEQYQRWGVAADKFEILGCFGMTELGHSSHLRGLETTATFIKETQEFEINSPTVTSSKWWIGLAGETATHIAVLANLFIDGKAVGLHWFVVQLRDRKSGKLMKGVQAGHLGVKMGRQGLDNGWVRFNRVRVPLDHMLCRWGKVEPNGEYSAAPTAQLAYATLIGERIWIFDSVYNQVGQAAVIGTRYGVVRRQGPNDEQIMDFPSHYTALMPIISLVYVSRLLWWQIGGEWGSILRANLTAGSIPPPEKLMDFLVDMQDYHAAICGTKAWTSWAGADAIEQVRRTMGGHAYSAYNAVGSLFGDFAVTTTGAGDNIVLAQQSGRYNVQVLRRIRQGKVMGRLGKSVSYLEEFEARGFQKFDLASFKTASNTLRLDALLVLLRNLAGGLTSRALSSLEDEMKNKKQSFDDACKSLMMDLVQVSKAQTSFYTLLKVLEHSQVAEELKQSQELRSVVFEVILLYALQQAVNHFTELLELGHLNVEATSYIRGLHSETCHSLRHICITLTDALGFPDEFIRAPLGKSDGDVYNAYFEQIMKSTKFRDHLPEGPVAPYWAQLVAPLTSITSSKL